MTWRAVRTATVLAASGLLLIACGHDHTSASLGSGFGLYYNDQGPTVSLAYGQANSDDVALMLQCAKHSGKVDVSDAVRGAGGPTLRLASSGPKTSRPPTPSATPRSPRRASPTAGAATCRGCRGLPRARRWRRPSLRSSAS